MANRIVQEFYEQGLRTVHQLFTSNGGRITPVSKEMDLVEEEFGIALPVLFRNKLIRLITLSRPNRNVLVQQDNCLIQFMKKAKNNQKYSALRLKDQRAQQQWGDGPRSYTTYLNDGVLNFPIRIYERNLEQLYKFQLSPGIRWINVQIFYEPYGLR